MLASWRAADRESNAAVGSGKKLWEASLNINKDPILFLLVLGFRCYHGGQNFPAKNTVTGGALYGAKTTTESTLAKAAVHVNGLRNLLDHGWWSFAFRCLAANAGTTVLVGAWAVPTTKLKRLPPTCR